MQPRPQVLLVFQDGVENEKTLGMSCARLEAWCGGTGREIELKLLNSTRLFHMHSRKEKEGLSIPPALNGVADSDLQVSGGLGGRGHSCRA